MTESNLPAIPDKTPPREIAVTDTDSWIDVARPVIALAERIADTEFVPKGLRGSAPATAAAMLYGREIGLPPMTALNMTHVIEGKPGIEAEGMRALVYAAGHELEFVESTGAICTMRGRRAGQERWTSVTWSTDMARAAGLLGKSNWKGYPRAMLVARATTDLCRMIFPDVIHGFRTVEELQDMTPEVRSETSEQPQTGRKVSRARKTADAPAPALPAPAEAPAERPSIAGPPLPGEDGYEPAPLAPPEQPAGGDKSEPEGEAGEEAPPPAGADPAEGDASPPSPSTARGPRKASRPQLRMIEGSLTTLGVDEDRAERHLIAGALAGRAVTSFNDLTSGDASKIIDSLARLDTKEALSDFLDALEDAKGDEE